MLGAAWSLLRNFAATGDPCALEAKGTSIIPPWYKYLGGEEIAGRCSVVMDFPSDTGKILLAVVEILLRIGGLVAIGFVIYGGFRFILSTGEPDKAKDARQTIINSLIGLVIALLATVIVNLIGNNLIIPDRPIDTSGIILPQTSFTNNSVQAALNIVFGVAGGIALLIITLAGMRYVLSRGDPQATATAKNTIIYALIGLFVTITAYGIVTFVVTRV